MVVTKQGDVTQPKDETDKYKYLGILKLDKLNTLRSRNS